MKKLGIFILLLHVQIYAADDDKKLQLLARQHAELVTGIVDSLHYYQERPHIPKSLLIMGESHNGRTSLAYEIAKRSGRTFDEHVPREHALFDDFMKGQLSKEGPHITILNRLHLLGGATAHLEDYMAQAAKNRQLFLIGIAHERFMVDHLPTFFRFRFSLRNPQELTRREIISYSLGQDHIHESLLHYFATKTAGVSSGNIALLFMELAHRADNLMAVKELFDQRFSYLVPEERRQSNVLTTLVIGAAITIPVLEVWSLIAQLGAYQEPRWLVHPRRTLINVLPHIIQLARYFQTQ